MDSYVKAMLGVHAIHVPLNLVVQNHSTNGDGTVIGVFQTRAGMPLLFGSKKTHQLIIADAFIRPQLVLHSDHLQGAGLSNILISGFTQTEEWLAGGIVLDPFNRASELRGKEEHLIRRAS